MQIVRSFKSTFTGIVLRYDVSITKQHRLVHITVDGSQYEGPWLEPEHHVISYEWRTRFFVAQNLTDDMPEVFEIIAPREFKITTRLPGE